MAELPEFHLTVLGTCGTCRHWGDTDWARYPDGWRECRMAAGDAYPNDKPNTGQLAIARGGDLGSDLATASVFGCVLWENKE